MYLAIVLDQESVESILSMRDWDAGSEVVCHHVTICMGSNSKGKYPFTVGEQVKMEVDGIGESHGHCLPNKGLDGLLTQAVRVRLPEGKFIKNETPHVTVTVCRKNGGKPVHSNRVWHWANICPMEISGTVELCD